VHIDTKAAQVAAKNLADRDHHIKPHVHIDTSPPMQPVGSYQPQASDLAKSSATCYNTIQYNTIQYNTKVDLKSIYKQSFTATPSLNYNWPV
jgi:hypothetical protein